MIPSWIKHKQVQVPMVRTDNDLEQNVDISDHELFDDTMESDTGKAIFCS